MILSRVLGRYLSTHSIVGSKGRALESRDFGGANGSTPDGKWREWVGRVLIMNASRSEIVIKVKMKGSDGSLAIIINTHKLNKFKNKNKKEDKKKTVL